MSCRDGSFGRSGSWNDWANQSVCPSGSAIWNTRILIQLTFSSSVAAPPRATTPRRIPATSSVSRNTIAAPRGRCSPVARRCPHQLDALELVTKRQVGDPRIRDPRRPARFEDPQLTQLTQYAEPVIGDLGLGPADIELLQT